MLTTVQHMDSSSSTYASPSPWRQLILRADRGHVLPYDYDLASAPAPPPSAPTRAPPHQHQHRTASARRVVAKRRPRPSRRLPTTYISADPAEFRRMVHQVTGADDLIPPPRPEEEDQLLLPCRYPASAPVASGALLLPTLDTSAFLLGRARTEDAPPCDSSAAGLLPLDSTTGGGGNFGFPTLDSWDLL